MTGYVLQRIEDGKYVARPGSEHSYTRCLERAQVFRSFEIACGAKCDNERVVPLDSLIGARLVPKHGDIATCGDCGRSWDDSFHLRICARLPGYGQ